MAAAETTLIDSDTNRAAVRGARNLLDAVLQIALRPGYYGTVTVELTVRDGTVTEMRDTLDRKHRPAVAR